MDKIYEENKVEMEVDLGKRFCFPQEIAIKKYKEFNLVIYTKGVLWLVLSDEELPVYNFFSDGGSIEEALQKYDEDIVVSVLSQIEGKQFENPVVNKNEELNIYIYLTNNCNEKCKHCYMYAGDINIQELEAAKWIDVLTQYKVAGGKGVTFTGGEITVYKDYKKILKHAKNLGLIVTVLTNGIRWSKEDIKECSKYIDEIQVSIDGYNKSSYYEVRQYDGFEKALDTVYEFNKQGTRCSIAVTPLYDDLDDFIRGFEPFAKNLILTHPEIFIRFNLELLDGRDVKKTQIDNNEYRKKLRNLVERLWPDYYTESFPLNYENHMIRNNCGFGEIAIASNGDIYWCNRIHELDSIYNICSLDFSDILNYSQNIKTKTSVDNTAICKNCEIKYICGGSCRMNYEGIRNADRYEGEWQVKCSKGTKENIYNKMIACNEYFYRDLDEV